MLVAFTPVRHVLLVDGRAAELLLVCTVLDHLALNLTVECAEDGADALLRLQTDPVPDLVLLSLQLPRVSGLEVLETLQRHPTSARVVLWSTSLSPGTAARALELGASAALEKSATYDELETQLRTLLTSPLQ